MKNGFKKFLSVILCVLLIAFSFAGCSSATGESINSSSLKNFKANVYDILVGEEKAVKFTVESVSATDIKLMSNESEGSITSLSDNGTNGDDIAGDGIYSAEVTLSKDSRTLVDYYAKAGNDKSNTFTISFYQEITEDEYDSHESLAKKIGNSNDYESALETIKDSDEIVSFEEDKEAKTITYKSQYGISGVWAEFSEGTKCFGSSSSTSYDTPNYESVNDTIDSSNFATLSSKKSVLVLRPFRGSQFKYDDFADAGNALANASNGACVVLDDNRANIDAFKKFGDYGIVLVDSHGTKAYENPYILTGEELSYESVRLYSADFNANRMIEASSVKRVCINSGFFNKYYPTSSMNDTTAFLGCCYSAMNSSFGNTMLQKGSPLVLGFSSAVTVSYCNATLHQFMVKDMLLDAMEADAAFNHTVKICGKDDGKGAEFVMFKPETEVRLFDNNHESNTSEIKKFTTVDSMELKLGEAGVIEPEVNPEDAEYIIHWTSSDTSIVSVGTEGEIGVLNAVGVGEATITAELISGSDILTQTTEVSVTTDQRDVILVLDRSSSMSGEPFDEMQEVAINFCDDILKDNKYNRVAVVSYNDSIDSMNLTNDIDEVKNYIYGLYATGTTNIQGALAEADEIFAYDDNDKSLKSVILMTDGLPNEGKTSKSGSFTSKASTNFSSSFLFVDPTEYANGVVDEAEILMKKYNMYSLGFFHSLYGDELDYGRELVEMLTNQPDGYHEVVDASNLQFAFGDIGNTITDGSKIIVNIACPVDATISCDGETLSSANASDESEASFGSLKLLGKNKDIKLFVLDSDKQYDIDFNGTGDGTMDYTINYYDEDNKLEDYRNFLNVPLTSSTKMKSSTENTSNVTLDIDSNGDGNYDDVWEADKNTSGSSSTQKAVDGKEYRSSEVNSNTWIIIVGVAVAVILIILLIIIIAVGGKKKKAEPVEEKKVEKPQPQRQPQRPVSPPPSYPRPVRPPVAPIASKPARSEHYVIVYDGNKELETYNIIPGVKFKVGRDSEWARIMLPASNSKISRKHCEIQYQQEKGYYLVNDISTNGVYVDNKRLEKGINRVQTNKRVKIANTSVELELH